MFTTIIALAFTVAAPTEVTWNTNYTAAKKLCAENQKPMAVFVGSGVNGYEKLSRERQFSAEVRQELANNFVCVFLDTNTPEGKKLARDFEITGDLGIVISDRTGNLQAFYHEGDLSNAYLFQYLQKYGDPKYIVERTDSNPGNHGPGAKSVVLPYTPPCVGCAGGCCGR